MIHVTHTKPTGHTLGGAEFIAPASRSRASDMHLRVVVDAGATNPEPVELALCASGVRTYTELSVEEAETLAVCLASAVRLRRAAEDRATEQARKTDAMESRRLQTFFADPDGALETGRGVV
jgi:uncharacterized caspase-like protein